MAMKKDALVQSRRLLMGLDYVEYTLEALRNGGNGDLPRPVTRMV